MCCRKNALMISENERVYIRNLYGLLTEETEPSYSLPKFRQTFPGSKYLNIPDQAKNELLKELQKASTWLSENKDAIIYVKIIAGESRLKNQDREQSPPVSVPEEYLSRQRAKTMKRFLKDYFKGLITDGVINEMPVFESPKIVIGETEVTKDLGPLPGTALSKYEDEQFVSLEMKLMAPGRCLINLEVEVMYNKEPNALFKCRGGHQCDVAKFDVKLNGISIGIADLNNANDGGSRTSGKLIINEKKALEIAGKDKRVLVFSLKCLSGNQCHSGTPEIKIMKDKDLIYHSCSPALSERGDESEIEILKLNPCGEVLEKGTGDASNKDIMPSSQGGKMAFTLKTPSDYSGTMVDFVKQVISKQIKNYTYKWLEFPFYNYKAPHSTDKSYDADDINLCGYALNPNGTLLDANYTIQVPKTGFTYKNSSGSTSIMLIDPDTRFCHVIEKTKVNKNPAPSDAGTTDQGEVDTKSLQYHSVSTGEGTSKIIKLVAGRSQAAIDKQKAENEKQLAAEKTAGVIRFTADEDTQENFEKFYTIDNKIAEKTKEGYFKVISDILTYGGKQYKKGTLIKFMDA